MRTETGKNGTIKFEDLRARWNALPATLTSVETLQDILEHPERYTLHTAFSRPILLADETEKLGRPLSSLSFLFEIAARGEDRLFFQVTYTTSRNTPNPFVSLSILIAPSSDPEAQTAIVQSYSLTDHLEPVGVRTEKVRAKIAEAVEALQSNEVKLVRIRCTNFINLPGKLTTNT